MGYVIDTSKTIDVVLKSIVLAGVGGALLLAPNSSVLAQTALRSLDERSRRREIRRISQYMVRRGLATYREDAAGNLSLTINEAGKKRVKKLLFDELAIAKPERWDEKWRLVLFDVPESRRSGRRALSVKLSLLGLYQLQKSVWIYPYPCADEVDLIRDSFGLHKSDIIIAEAERLDSEYELRKRFKLHA